MLVILKKIEKVQELSMVFLFLHLENLENPLTLQNGRYAAEMVTMFKIHDGSAPT